MLESYMVAAFAAVAHIAVFITARQLTSYGWFVLELLTGGLVFLAGLTVGILAVEDFSLWYYLALYSVGWWCFFFVSSIFYVSVSVQIIRYLSERPDGSASVDELYHQCIEAPFAERAAFLVQTGQADEMAGGYRASPQGLKTADRIRRVRQLFGFSCCTGYYTNSKEEE